MSQIIATFYGVGPKTPSTIVTPVAGSFLFAKTIYPGLPQAQPAGATLGDLALPNQLLVIRKNVLNGQDFEIDIAGSVTIGAGVTGGTFSLVLAQNLITRIFTPNPGATIPGGANLYSVGGLGAF